MFALLAALATSAGVLAVPAMARPTRHPTKETAKDTAQDWWGGQGETGSTQPGTGPGPGDQPAPGGDPGTGAGPGSDQGTGTPPSVPVFPICTDTVDRAVEFSIPVPGDDRLAHGFYAVPDSAPVGMVVFSHGYGHSSYSWQQHVARVARDLHVVTIAMDGRDLHILSTEKAPGIPNTAGWPVTSAAADGITAAKLFQAACPTIGTIVNYGVSLGGNTSGIMAASGATRIDGTPLFDWWVDIEGVNNLIETYFEARGASPAAQADIEEETGGSFESDPAPFQARTNVLHTQDMKAAGLKGVVLVQGVDDGLVPYNQSQEMFDALNAVGIPTQYFTVTLKSDQSEAETTLSGTVGKKVDPSYRSPLAGHTSEMSTTHIVSLTGFDRLDAIFAGHPPACTRLAVVDGQVGSTPNVDC
ncbi:MAG: hypothetical protein QOI20_47 [Acidimicrobiaceae bacterium]|jgi:hypothetical protein|nr:hypothetical protein [Acidimicrobiaceae bacterium]